MLEKKSEIRQLHCVLRDLGILSRATASHCGLLTGDLYPVYADRVVSVVQVLLQGLQFLNDSVDCLRNFQAHAPLPRDFVYLHAALYQSLESLFPWLTQFYSTHVHGSTDGLNKLVAAVIKTCLDPVCFLYFLCLLYLDDWLFVLVVKVTNRAFNRFIFFCFV